MKNIAPTSHPDILPSSDEAYDVLANFRRNVSIVQAPPPVKKPKAEKPVPADDEPDLEHREVGDENFSRKRLKAIAAQLKARGLHASDSQEKKELLYGANLFYHASVYAPSFSREGLVRANI